MFEWVGGGSGEGTAAQTHEYECVFIASGATSLARPVQAG